MRVRIAKRVTVASSVVGLGVLAGSPAWAQNDVPGGGGFLAKLLGEITGLLERILSLL